MNLKEHAVLNAMNQASHLHRDFWVTAQDIVYEVKTNSYLRDEKKVLPSQLQARDIGYLLRSMASDPRLCIRGQTLVEKRRVRGTNQWRATSEAITAVCV